jgi:hypothetical protein
MRDELVRVPTTQIMKVTGFRLWAYQCKNNNVIINNIPLTILKNKGKKLEIFKLSVIGATEIYRSYCTLLENFCSVHQSIMMEQISIFK